MLVALAVLAVASIVVLRSRGRRPTPPCLTREPLGHPVGPDADVLVAMAVTGEALIDSGFDVTEVQSDLDKMGRAYGVPNAEIVVLPDSGPRLRTRRRRS